MTCDPLGATTGGRRAGLKKSAETRNAAVSFGLLLAVFLTAGLLAGCRSENRPDAGAAAFSPPSPVEGSEPTGPVFEHPYSGDELEAVVTFDYLVGPEGVSFHGRALEGGRPGVDTTSFEVLNPHVGYARDKNQVYFRDRVVEGADPAGFRVLAQRPVELEPLWRWRLGLADQPRALYARTAIATDGRRIFFDDRLIDGLDAFSFVYLGQYHHDPGYDEHGRRNPFTPYHQNDAFLYMDRRGVYLEESDHGRPGLRTGERLVYPLPWIRIDMSDDPRPEALRPLGSRGLYTDGDNVFFRQFRVCESKSYQPPAAPDGLYGLCGGEAVFQNRPVGRKLRDFRTPVPAADYLVAADRIFFRDLPLEPPADPATFEILEPHRHYARDRHRVYYQNNPLAFDRFLDLGGREAGPEVDPATFEALGREGLYGRDANCLYYQAKQIACGRAAESRLIDEGEQAIAADGISAFHGPHRVEGSDGPSYELLGYIQDGPFRFSPLTRDRHRVYWRGRPVEGADPAGFEILSVSGYGRDARHVYFRDQRLDQADPAGFRPVPPADEAEYLLSLRDGPVGGDGNHYWRGDRRLYDLEYRLTDRRLDYPAGEYTVMLGWEGPTRPEPAGERERRAARAFLERELGGELLEALTLPGSAPGASRPARLLLGLVAGATAENPAGGLGGLLEEIRVDGLRAGTLTNQAGSDRGAMFERLRTVDYAGLEPPGGPFYLHYSLAHRPRPGVEVHQWLSRVSPLGGAPEADGLFAVHLVVWPLPGGEARPAARAVMLSFQEVGCWAELEAFMDEAEARKLRLWAVRGDGPPAEE